MPLRSGIVQYDSVGVTVADPFKQTFVALLHLQVGRQTADLALFLQQNPD